MNEKKALQRLGSQTCKKILGLFAAEKEFAVVMAGRLESLRQEMDEQFGEISKKERMEFMRKHLVTFSDEEFGAMFGISAYTIRSDRSKAGINRGLNRKLTERERRNVKNIPPENITRAMANSLGSSQAYLKSLSKAGGE